MISISRLYQINSSRILQHIRTNPGISRIAVANELGLDRSTITKIVNYLIDIGMVLTTGKYHGKAGVGRKATALQINPTFGLVLGIEVQTDFFQTVLVNLNGQIIQTESYPYQKGNKSLEEQLEFIISSAKEKAIKERIPLLGSGIGLAGVIDPYNGIIIESYPLQLGDGMKLKKYLESRTELPVFIENDANCCCWSDIAFRPGQQHRNFLALLGEFRSVDITGGLTRGIAFGLGITIRGRVLHGDTFSVGEFRSLLYDYEKPSRVQFSITDEEASSLPENRELLLRVFKELAFNMSILVNSLDISKILLAGDFAQYKKDLELILNEAIQKNWLYESTKKCVIESSPGGDKAVSLGAAGLFISKLFSVPDMTDHIEEDVGNILLEKIVQKED
ncbi:MAG: ROK family transcriptional regulator [Spirochaetaceae bacterium]|jgi:predicted NBD/HSP70 family sugar kinase|nr:ROK family transcriptional regulator [Spirochaetaceae bacterium]